MRLLLDTHALLWWLSDDERLGPQARELIADPGNDLLVSVVSLWEIAIKQRVGQLDADIAEIMAAIGREGFLLLDVKPAHLIALASVPMHHRDPFDHLMIAQAITEDATFVSDDRHTPSYAARWMPCAAATIRG